MVLPSGRCPDREFCAAQEVIELGPVAVIGRLQGGSVEIPFARDTGVRVGVAEPHTKRGVVIQCSTHICALERIGIGIVDPRTGGVELVSEEVVIVAAVSAGETRVPIGGRKVSAIGSETKFGSESVAGARPDLDYASDCIRPIERALRAADKFRFAELRLRKHVIRHARRTAKT